MSKQTMQTIGSFKRNDDGSGFKGWIQFAIGKREVSFDCELVFGSDETVLWLEADKNGLEA